MQGKKCGGVELIHICLWTLYFTKGEEDKVEKEVGRQHQGMDRPGVRQVPEDSGEQGKIEDTSCETICGTPTTLAVKG